MTVHRVEVGLVSGTDGLVEFYRTAFALQVLEPRPFPTGVVHRLGTGDVILKILVPAVPPAAPSPASGPFWEQSGLRYFTFWVDDLDAVAERCVRAGGAVETGPVDVRPGVRALVVRDPQGNVAEIMEEKP